MPTNDRVLVVIGVGGTIAGRADRPEDHTGYRVGELGVEDLLRGLPRPDGFRIEARQLAQLDSKDMDSSTWQALHACLVETLHRSEVAGVVVTHGTDTLEETAWFLHRCVQARRPVVLTAAMRPASAPSADGPQNLADALAVAAEPDAAGVLAVMNGQVYAGTDLRKVHGYRLDAFTGGDAGPVAVVEEGRVRRFRGWPQAPLHAAPAASVPAAQWPWVELLTSTAGARAEAVDALVQAGVHGLVIAGTGNGTVHRAWTDALARAQAAGVAVRRASRCQLGGIVGAADGLAPSAGSLSAVQARVELMLDLLAKVSTPADHAAPTPG